MVSGLRFNSRSARRGVTLVEVMALVIVVAVAVPPIAALSLSTTRAVVEEQRTFHTTWLASAVLEQIVADAGTGAETMDLEAMGDAAYLNDPFTGLRARLSVVTAEYLADGLTYEVAFGPTRDATGAVVDVSESSATRLVTVDVLYSSQLGQSVRASFSTVVGNP